MPGRLLLRFGRGGVVLIGSMGRSIVMMVLGVVEGECRRVS